MKLGCASWGFREMSLVEYFEAAVSLGLKYIEVECFNEEEAPGHIPSDCTPEKMVELQEKAKEKNLKIVSFAGGNDFTIEDKSLIENDIIRIKKMIDLAKAGGVEIIRLFAGWISEDKIIDSTYGQVIDGFKEAGKYAQDNSIILALENHGGITSTPEQVKRILTEVTLSSVGLNYDPANFHHCKIDPAEALKELKNYIVYAHLKDSQFRSNSHEFKAVGEGEINWSPIINWLNFSYNGYAMVEYENPDDVIEGTGRSINFFKDKGIVL